MTTAGRKPALRLRFCGSQDKAECRADQTGGDQVGLREKRGLAGGMWPDRDGHASTLGQAPDSAAFYRLGSSDSS